jgi:hypothetical protein
MREADRDAGRHAKAVEHDLAFGGGRSATRCGGT